MHPNGKKAAGNWECDSVVRVLLYRWTHSWLTGTSEPLVTHEGHSLKSIQPTGDRACPRTHFGFAELQP